LISTVFYSSPSLKGWIVNTESNFRQPSHADIERAMGICVRLHQVEPGKSFIHHSHAILDQAFDNIRFSAEVYQLKPFRLREQKIHTPDHDYWNPLFKEHILGHPEAQRVIVVTDSDRGMIHLEPALKGFRYSVLYNEFHDQVKPPCQLWIGIRDGNELLNCIYSRDEKCTEEQLAMMCLIQFHLETAWKNWKQARALQQKLNLLTGSTFRSEEEDAVAVQLRKALESLTDRQRDVAEQVALGKDNQQIADEMEISVLTVKKHLQAIFKTLDVQHRTELAAKWHDAYFVRLSGKTQLP